ncbi:MAG TPA: hypothetical protein VGP64_14280 [Polyangia bacterium]
MTRKEFVTLTFTLLGGAAAAAACSSSPSNSGTGGTNGAGGGSANGCTDPLPETQLPDDTMHTHTLSIPAADLSSTTDMTVNTGVTNGHMHMVTLTVANLATLKGGGMVDEVSSLAGTPSHMHTFSVSCTAGLGTGAAGASGAAGTTGAAGATGAAGTSGSAGISGAAGH